MTKIHVNSMILMVCLGLLFPQAATCEVKAGSIHISPMAGGYFFEGDQPIQSGPIVALGFAYNLSDTIGLELMGKAGEFDFFYCELCGDQPLEDSLYGYWAHLDARYHLWPKNRLVPYLALGGGYMWLDDDRYIDTESPFAHYGAGFFFELTDKFHLRGDVRHVLPFDDEHNNLSAILGISLALGGAAQPLKDSDNDGVFDHKDHCPDTPFGVKVDQWGCPLDNDQDGVPDYEDQCPGTLPGVRVDPHGCPANQDKDGDGVKDDKDRCPDTPKGTKVDKHGCKAVGDSDGDGVPDHIDRCPDTPLVADVNSVGCWVIKDLHFDFDKAFIKKRYYKSLDKIVSILKKNPFLNVEIQGHTDNRGGKQYNKKLSETRAKAVARYLIKRGIRAARISYVGYGYELPIATNKTDEGRALNRRVQVKPMK
ncbi:MAG: OmpA-OmpF porin, OOP family [Candidatus Magnetoglobus multicellularis str. Araruama]|uniref:OmpA-OmpF porin, OOP family n=1 Tax=Candidatus Magnetoglobus multicellularis str. Araruama TaxID=890399 RepID=A0A1V1P7Z2_9BACT|nr:MAG: OmpA-OmpF porin, OOP family [Candidatus Magnetoglobus multicellularis str. Araruama]